MGAGNVLNRCEKVKILDRDAVQIAYFQLLCYFFTFIATGTKSKVFEGILYFSWAAIQNNNESNLFYKAFDRIMVSVINTIIAMVFYLSRQFPFLSKTFCTFFSGIVFWQGIFVQPQPPKSLLTFSSNNILMLTLNCCWRGITHPRLQLMGWALLLLQ